VIALPSLSGNSIRGRLWFGLGILIVLLIVAGFVARRSFSGITLTITESLAEVQTEAQLASQLSADVAKTIDAGSRYLETRDTLAANSFRHFGMLAHDVQREMNNRPGQSAAEVATVATIDGKLSEMEIHYALAHRLSDLGRAEESRKVAGENRRSIDELLSDIARLGRLDLAGRPHHGRATARHPRRVVHGASHRRTPRHSRPARATTERR
jgi:hypothetical protein